MLVPYLHIAALVPEYKHTLEIKRHQVQYGVVIVFPLEGCFLAGIQTVFRPPVHYIDGIGVCTEESRIVEAVAEEQPIFLMVAVRMGCSPVRSQKDTVDVQGIE